VFKVAISGVDDKHNYMLIYLSYSTNLVLL
jgi:catabolite regulation protein CreA